MDPNDISSPSSSSSSFNSIGSNEYDDAVESAVVLAINLVRHVVAENEDEEPPPRGFHRRVVIDRRGEEAERRLMQDYFVDAPTFNPRQFRRRFRMHKPLFLRITGDLERKYRYFQQIYNGVGKFGFTAIQKCTSAIRQLAYGLASDQLDEHLHMSERTSRESLQHFYIGILLKTSRDLS
uniref:uncharacterized protein LOC122592786 n=1 Tax=Erigeron canadensis TaxID=72917 RepID=UPI001CB910C1|nr:uncharacterized protein LOC122592786 [Erigeron canadensis]